MEEKSFYHLVISGLIHELRNPLNSIYMNIQLLEEEIEALNIGDSQREELLDLVNSNKKEIKRLNTILSESLKFIKPLELEFKKSNINRLIDEVLRVMDAELEKAGVSVKRYYDNDPIYAMVDENGFKQVFFNIFLNSKEAMKEGGILSVNTKRMDKEIRITVSDTGCGIKEEDIKKVFDPFFSTKKDGMGIGLTIAKKIVEAHRGRISIESKENTGSRVNIILPLLE